jgi:hypothetical protein
MSEVKVNKISPRTACGTVTLGDSGDTFTIPAGATINNQGTATNFGATGSASWVTTVKTSSPFTAVAGEGYFVNTTSGPITVNLPAGTAGAVVAIKDYANTFDSNGVTLVQNGSDKIGGSTVNGILTVEGIAVTLVYVDSTQGWLVTDSGLQSEAPTALYVTATGGTPTTSPCGDYRIHTFTGPGALCVSCAGNPAGSALVDYLVVGGGGGGGSAAPGNTGAAGGAGGFRESPGTASGSYTVSPLGVSPAVALSVSVQPYTIQIGGGGPGGPSDSAKGVNGGLSSFSTITSAGGGGGGSNGNRAGSPGGSGGGGAGGSYNQPGGSGNTPSVSPAQGTNGGNSSPGPSGSDGGSGGGGGAIEAGVFGTPSPAASGRGGAGTTTSINGSSLAFAGGGGGGSYPATTPGSGSPCGTGGAGGNPVLGPLSNSVAGTINRGGGGGGAGGNPTGATGIGANGGSGIVIIRYKFQN